MPIRVGRPCACETALITATSAELNDTTAVMLPAHGRAFGLNLNEFLSKGTMPEPGKTYKVSKRSITQGTCSPLMHDLVGPATDDTAPSASPDN